MKKEEQEFQDFERKRTFKPQNKKVVDLSQQINVSQRNLFANQFSILDQGDTNMAPSPISKPQNLEQSSGMQGSKVLTKPKKSLTKTKKKKKVKVPGF